MMHQLKIVDKTGLIDKYKSYFLYVEGGKGFGADHLSSKLLAVLSSPNLQR